ncbi:MAG: YceI family protein [Anaerolineales bacterium]|nr:YceI family protein [Anaerolineales bacterium]
MKLKRLAIGFIAGLILMGIAVGIYWFSRDVEAEENKLSVPSLEEENAQIYLIDPSQTTLNFTIESSLRDITGTFDIVGRWFELTETPDGWRVAIVLDIDGRTADTGMGLVDTLIREGFQAERYPIGRFVGEADTLIDDLSVPHDVNMVGQLELSGVVKDYSIAIHFQIKGDTLIANANTTIDAADFAVDFASQIGSTDLDTKIKVVAVRSDDPIEDIRARFETPTPSNEG